MGDLSKNNSINYSFYEHHSNFIYRTIDEYNLAPGIRCKYDIILDHIGKLKFSNGLDIGCSGNSIFFQMENIENKFFVDIAHLPLTQYKSKISYFPICSSITHVPFKTGKFDIITALDVLEHLEDDKVALSEMYRLLNTGGFLVITVPHRMKFFTDQDLICGHYRRYEYDELITLFSRFGFKELMVFPVYGQIMKIQFLQRIDPKGTELKISKLRDRYQNNLFFRKTWDVFVSMASRLMKIDAKIQQFRNSMDICIILRKD